jgi:tRNA threonylcarbamoyladenosine biosynthesis protein TsaB
MKILALEFSSEQRSVAVQVDGVICSTASELGGRTTRVLGLVERVLQEAGLEREAVECLAVGLGPGSYAGIRAAIALAQGWQLARPVKVLGISSALSLAAEAQSEKVFGQISLVIDAQRNEFYLARYEVSAVGLREMEPLHIATRPEVQARSEAGDILIGPEVTQWFPGGRTLFAGAAALARLASERREYVAAETLEPIYLRETAFVKAPPARVITV